MKQSPQDPDSRLRQLAEGLRQEKERLAEELAALAGQNVDLALQVGELEEELALLRGQRDKASHLEAQLQASQAEEAAMKSALAQQARELASAETRLAEARGSLEGVVEQRTRLQGQVEGLEREREDLRQELQAARDLEGQRQAELQARLAEQETLRAEAEDLRGRLARLEEDLSEREEELRQTFLPRRAATQTPQEVLAARLEDSLGSMGRPLLEKARQRCGVDVGSEAPEDLEKLVTFLREPALRLCRTPSQREGLEAALRGSLEVGPVEAPAPAPGSAEPEQPGALPLLPLEQCLEEEPSPLPGQESAAESPGQTLRRLLQEPSPARPRERAVVALLREGLEAALEAGKGDPLPQGEPGPGLVEQARNPALKAALSYLLEDVVPRSGLTLALPSPDFAARLGPSTEPDASWPPAALTARLGSRVFGLEDL